MLLPWNSRPPVGTLLRGCRCRALHMHASSSASQQHQPMQLSHSSWATALKPELDRPSWQELCAFLEEERAFETVVPPADRTFAAFDACSFDAVSVVILGQDPYPTPGHAHGLAFSVPPTVRPLPGSLRNIYKELQRDVGVPAAPHGNLEAWASQGVLLLNSVLCELKMNPEEQTRRLYTAERRIADVLAEHCGVEPVATADLQLLG